MDAGAFEDGATLVTQTPCRDHRRPDSRHLVFLETGTRVSHHGAGSAERPMRTCSGDFDPGET